MDGEYVPRVNYNCPGMESYFVLLFINADPSILMDLVRKEGRWGREGRVTESQTSTFININAAFRRCVSAQRNLKASYKKKSSDAPFSCIH